MNVSSQWEFLPNSDSASIFIDYDDNCIEKYSRFDVDGVLFLKTEDGTIDAKWNTTLSLNAGFYSAQAGVAIGAQELQGLPELLEGDEHTSLWVGVLNGELLGDITRTYGRDLTPIEGEDGYVIGKPIHWRQIAVIGNWPGA